MQQENKYGLRDRMLYQEHRIPYNVPVGTFRLKSQPNTKREPVHSMQEFRRNHAARQLNRRNNTDRAKELFGPITPPYRDSEIQSARQSNPCSTQIQSMQRISENTPGEQDKIMLHATRSTWRVDSNHAMKQINPRSNSSPNMQRATTKSCSKTTQSVQQVISTKARCDMSRYILNFYESCYGNTHLADALEKKMFVSLVNR